MATSPLAMACAKTGRSALTTSPARWVERPDGLQVAHEPLDVVPADRARVVQAELGREHVRE